MNDEQSQLQLEARQLTRRIPQGALATLDRNNGEPYASLAMVALDYDGSPILFISRLSDHRKNIDTDNRISVLFDGTAGAHPPLAGARLSVQGVAELSDAAHLRRRFIARHEDAEQYAQFADFGFYRLAVSRAHFVAGFGRVHWLPREGLMLDELDIGDWCSAEPAIMDTIASRFGEMLQKRFESDAMPTVTGIDPDGIDLRLETAIFRLSFARPMTTPDGVIKALEETLETGPEPA